MAVKLSLDKRIDEVFSEYKERFVGNSIVFEGCLLPHNERARDKQIMRFVSGGRRYLGYEIKRDGAYVKGVIRYRPLAHRNPRSVEIGLSRMDLAIEQEPKKRPKTKADSDDQIKTPKKPGKKRAVDDELAVKIRDMYKDGATQVSIAKKFYLNKKTVNLVVNKKGAYAE